jgi:PAS domain S-box-containing protein
MAQTPLTPEALQIFETVPDLYLILSPSLRVLTASNAYLKATLSQREDMVGKHIFEVFPDNPSTPEANSVKNLQQSLQTALATQVPHQMALQRYDVPRSEAAGGGFEEKYWQPLNTPILNGQGQVAYIIHKVSDATEEVNRRQQLEELTDRERVARQHAGWESQKLERVLLQAPVGIGIFEGEDHVISLANNHMCVASGRTAEELLGKTVFDALPEVKDQGFEALLAQVYQTGQPAQLLEVAAKTKQGNTLVEGFYNIVYQPLLDANQKITGIIQIFTEVTQQVQARQKAEQLNQELEKRVLERTQRLQQAQRQLEAERSLLQAMLDQAPVAMSLLIGEELEIATANKNMCYFWGRTSSEVLNKNLLEALPELKGQGFDDLLREVLRTGEPYIGNELAATMLRQGKMKTNYYNVVYHPLYDQQEKILGVVIVAIEVTELVEARKLAEEREEQLKILNRELEERVTLRTGELEESRRLAEYQRAELQNIFEQAPVAIAVFRGPKYTIELANPAVCQLWGRTPEQALNTPLFELLPEAAGQGFEELLDGVMATGKPYIAHELPSTINREGRQDTVYWNFVYHPLHNQQQEITGVTVVAAEVSEQVMARHKIEENEKRFRTLVESMPQMTWTNLPNGEVNFFSDRWYTYTGLCFQQLKDWGWEPIVHPADLPDMKETYLEALRTGEMFMHENRLKQHDGQWRWHLNRSLPVKNNNNEIILWVGTSTDIHEKRLAEETVQEITENLATVNEELRAANDQVNTTNTELANSNQQLSFINADLDNFIYTASHDLRAPISNIEGLMAALRKNLSPESLNTPVVIKLTGLIDSSIDRFKKTLSELTEITKLQRAGSGEDVSLIKLKDIFDDAKLDLAPQIEEAKAQVQIRLEDCPAIEFSAKNARSIAHNLLSNAIKYRSEQRPAQVLVSCTTLDNYLLLKVEDNGLGMNLSQENKIFAMFKRLHDHVEGTGVGLYIVKKIVENAGGKIEVESQVDEGSTFRVYFRHTKTNQINIKNNA